MVSGPDVITYIGVPLAVLGVLPIIYNTIATLATLAKVRRALRHGRLAGITRGDVINHVIEVELPRYTIAPYDRSEHHEEYWQLCTYPSSIPGGSWTIFNWKTNIIGLKTQRIDYSDQLRQPQAEIGFEELVGFLLDLGAVPDPTGFRMLRGSGLWAPCGTPLLRSPDRHEPVLTIAPLDDSDGHLSLRVRWSSDWGMRDPSSLPPYWVLIRGLPMKSTAKPISEDLDAGDLETQANKSAHSDTKSLAAARYTPILPDSSPSIRCQIGVNGLTGAASDDFDASLFESLNITHLQIDHNPKSTIGVWFASAITALGATSETRLWNYKVPSSILSFSQKDTFPCGLLVFLGLVDESSTPEWATKYPFDETERHEAAFKTQREQLRAMALEGAMRPEERERARWERTRKTHEDFVESSNLRRRREVQRAEQRMLEAVQSEKWDNSLVGQSCLKWLKGKGVVDEEHDLQRAAEGLLWRMIGDVEFVGKVGRSMNVWVKAVENGGLKKADYEILKGDVEAFAWGSLLVAMVKEMSEAVAGSAAADLQECLRLWKRVRLG